MEVSPQSGNSRVGVTNTTRLLLISEYTVSVVYNAVTGGLGHNNDRLTSDTDNVHWQGRHAPLDMPSGPLCLQLLSALPAGTCFRHHASRGSSCRSTLMSPHITMLAFKPACYIAASSTHASLPARQASKLLAVLPSLAKPQHHTRCTDLAAGILSVIAGLQNSGHGCNMQLHGSYMAADIWVHKRVYSPQQPVSCPPEQQGVPWLCACKWCSDSCIRSRICRANGLAVLLPPLPGHSRRPGHEHHLRTDKTAPLSMVQQKLVVHCNFLSL